ncbi:MAG: glycerate kinase [Candidatus Melainabacteria bacterium HGW-Melainabacteria-1]|nr:MAG: glycerate kinase [Candidatus Melainabacteria bacterium HGW-Melainabacteria-1]
MKQSIGNLDQPGQLQLFPRYLIACDKFKGSLDSLSAGQALAEGIREANTRARLLILSVADGGQGFLQALSRCYEQFELRQTNCRDPLGRQREGHYGWDPISGTAFIESAEAIGLPWLQPHERNPWHAHSAGLGDLMLATLRHMPERLYIGLGGSASCDGGLGCLEALGFELRDAHGRQLAGVPESLARIHSLKAPARTFPPIVAVCDVANPPHGARGGVRVYSPQKGADPALVERLEVGMNHWRRVLEDFAGESLTDLAGGGAAGCLGLALRAALGAQLVPGADWMLDQLAFDQALDWADMVLTGEGAVDPSSLEGKITGQILARAQLAGKPAWIVSGQSVSISGLSAESYALNDLDDRAAESPELSLELLRLIGQQIGSEVK